MRVEPLKRSLLTDHLVTVAKTQSIPVGRGSAPKDGGWSGPMGSSNFVDYVVIKAGMAVAPARGEPVRLGRQHTSWDFTFQVIGHGETEKRCDEAAHEVSLPLLQIRGDLDLDGVVWVVQLVDLSRLGATEWSNQDKEWRVTYDVSVHLSRKQVR